MNEFCDAFPDKTVAETAIETDRRFSGVARLYGMQGFARIRAAHAVLAVPPQVGHTMGIRRKPA